MATNTTYNPPNVKDFVKSALNFAAQGITATITANTTQNIDLLISGDHLITGADVLVQNANFGDHVSFKVIDISGKYTPAGTVLSQFVTDWYLRSDSQLQINLEVNYPAKILDGLYLRLVYVSTGTANPIVAVNYTLHEVLL